MAKIYVKKVPEEVKDECEGCCFFRNSYKNCKQVKRKYNISCSNEHIILKIVRIEK